MDVSHLVIFLDSTDDRVWVYSCSNCQCQGVDGYYGEQYITGVTVGWLTQAMMTRAMIQTAGDIANVLL